MSKRQSAFALQHPVSRPPKGLSAGAASRSPVLRKHTGLGPYRNFRFNVVAFLRD
jgi:hypothetical protein